MSLDGTYTGLLASVADYLARSDLSAVIPDFVSLAEAKFNRDLKFRKMESRSTTVIDTTTTEPQMISLPSDFQTMRSIKLTSVTGSPRLEYKSDAQMDEYRTSIANVTGCPLFFSIFGSEMELCPTPDQNYTIEMKYRANIPPLATNSTNWLLTLAPDLYLYGALLEAAPYLKDDARIQVWGAGLQNAREALNDLGQASGYGSGPLVMSVTGATP